MKALPGMGSRPRQLTLTMVMHRSRLLLLVLAGALLLAACSSTTGDGGAAGTQASGQSSPPAFSARTLSGTKIDSASFEGKPTVLWFWAPWCTVCRAEAPDVAEVAKAFKGKVDLVGVAGRAEVPAMNRFVDQTGTGGFTHAIDADGSIWADYGVVAQPAFAFIDAKGDVSVVAGRLGSDDLTKRVQALATVS